MVLYSSLCLLAGMATVSTVTKETLTKKTFVEGACETRDSHGSYIQSSITAETVQGRGAQLADLGLCLCSIWTKIRFSKVIVKLNTDEATVIFNEHIQTSETVPDSAPYYNVLSNHVLFKSLHETQTIKLSNLKFTMHVRIETAREAKAEAREANAEARG